jgi:hypothetical protein
MSNEFQVSNLIAKATTEFNEQRSPIFNTANRKYEGMYEQKEYATGGNIAIKIPGYPQQQNGLSVTPQGIQDLVVNYPITPEDIYNVPRQLNVYEQMFNILRGTRALTDNDKAAIVDNYAYPAYEALEGAIESKCALELKTNAFYSPIDTIDKLSAVNNYSSISSVTTLFRNLKLGNERYLMMNNDDAQSVADSLQNSFVKPLNKDITYEALVGGPDKGRLAGLDMYMSSELRPHQAGQLAGASGMTVTAISADGLTLTISGVPANSSQQINAGDRFSIPGIFWVDPITKAVLSTRVTVAASEDSDGNGDGTIQLVLNYPLLFSGEHANISATPAAGNPIYGFGDYNLNFAYVPSGLNAVAVKMTDVFGAINSDVKGNVKVPTKVYMQGTVSNLNNIFRISMIAAIKAITPYIICLPSAV